jgi:hypothetical protein
MFGVFSTRQPFPETNRGTTRVLLSSRGCIIIGKIVDDQDNGFSELIILIMDEDMLSSLSQIFKILRKSTLYDNVCQSLIN